MTVCVLAAIIVGGSAPASAVKPKPNGHCHKVAVMMDDGTEHLAKVCLKVG